MVIIGLTGMRGVGKTEVADRFEARGFARVHPFDGGKAAVLGYYVHLGIDGETAQRMIYGDLKDTPCELLPNNETSRYFMERFGKWMGTELGVDWTLGAELDRVARKFPNRSIVAESVVYEAELLRQRSGTIVRVIRPDHKGPRGMATDAFQGCIKADFELYNNGTLADLDQRVGDLIEKIV